MEIGYGVDSTLCETKSVRSVNPTVEERLLDRKSQLERDLKDVNDAIEALQANPEILKVMSLISKVRY